MRGNHLFEFHRRRQRTVAGNLHDIRHAARNELRYTMRHGIGADGAGDPDPDSGVRDGAVPPDGCVPACEGRACGDDGCGGSCGDCDGDTPLSIDGTCAERPS